jgi:hypothetical protein
MLPCGTRPILRPPSLRLRRAWLMAACRCRARRGCCASVCMRCRSRAKPASVRSSSPSCVGLGSSWNGCSAKTIGPIAWRLLLGLFDGDDAAVRGMAADPTADEDVRAGLLEALARLAWEGRASREALVELLDRFDREELAPPASWAWYGWHSAIMLLGLTDWIERVQRASDAGRMVPLFDREVDRDDWLEGIRAAAEQPDDPQRFVSASLMPFDDPTKHLGWWPDPAGGPEDSLSEDEFGWLDVALWRRAGTDTMCLEWADGFFTALAVGPERLLPERYLPAIVGTSEAGPVFDSPQHDAYVAELLAHWFATIERSLADACCCRIRMTRRRPICHWNGGQR